MPTNFNSLRSAVAALLVLSACAADDAPSPDAAPAMTPPEPGAAPRPAAAPAAGSSGDLSEQDLADFYHLAEGSELLPLSWLFALKDPAAERAFLDDPERFGLLPDPGAPDGLPVGMTTEAGFNCAACHVGEVHYRGITVRIAGAPNLFDAKRFVAELFRAGRATLDSPAKVFSFVRDARRFEYARSRRAGLELWASMPELGELEAMGPLERALGARVREIHAEVMKSAADNDAARRGDLLGQRLTSLLGARAAPGSPMAGLSAERRGHAAREILSQLQRELRLLLGRIAQIRNVAQIDQPETTAGPGRVDAFGTARNLIFPRHAAPARAPVSYPHLFGAARTAWLHWDGNTNSSLERNFGQAIGLGAVVGERGESTLLPRNIHRLEQIAASLRSPAWPEAILGPIDRAKASRGEALFAARCAGCHDAGFGERDEIMALADIGTDPARAESFAGAVGGEPFAAALAGVLGQVKAMAFASSGIGAEEAAALEAGRTPVVWRATRGYAKRPLAGVWATAPYLHNGSVPTIHDLLLPAEDRPARFGVGSREYDPEKLGYDSEITPGVFTFDTAEEGNGHGGHSGPRFGTDLSGAQRGDLIEFLKTL